jgi:hypothetical protein
MVASDVAEGVLYGIHGITSAGKRAAVARNIELYVQQAYEFYEVASAAKANTAPLLYYYSFLQLAKAICEIANPQFHRLNESRGHGLSYSPSPTKLVNMNTEYVSVTRRRGVWHVLLEALQHQPFAAANVRFKVADLFELCPEISAEYQSTYGRPTRLIELIDPDLLVDVNSNDLWIRFSVERVDLRIHRLTRNRLLTLITLGGSTYRTVRSETRSRWTFELENAKRFTARYRRDLFELIQNEIWALNLFTALRRNGLVYAIPIQDRLQVPLPQIMVLYTLVFWLGSLVRYDPHSVAYLQDSGYWTIIDGVMTQSRIWLLELFEWELYKTETVLQSVR